MRKAIRWFRKQIGFSTYRVNSYGRWNYSYFDTAKDALAYANVKAMMERGEWYVYRINVNGKARKLFNVSAPMGDWTNVERVGWL